MAVFLAISMIASLWFYFQNHLLKMRLPHFVDYAKTFLYAKSRVKEMIRTKSKIMSPTSNFGSKATTSRP
jgi:hypothetical protein